MSVYCPFLSGGFPEMNGSSAHFHRSIFTNMFILIKLTRFERFQLYFAFFWMYLKSRIPISAVHIWMYTAFSDVPTKLVTLSRCLRCLKKVSISQRSL